MKSFLKFTKINLIENKDYVDISDFFNKNYDAYVIISKQGAKKAEDSYGFYNLWDEYKHLLNYLDKAAIIIIINKENKFWFCIFNYTNNKYYLYNIDEKEIRVLPNGQIKKVFQKSDNIKKRVMEITNEDIQ